MNEPFDDWLEFARQDLQMAELAMKIELYNQVCFHSQQCIEKSLKALLVLNGRNPPRTHSIVDLLEFHGDFRDELRTELEQMDAYYIPTRYPDALPGPVAKCLPGIIDAEFSLAAANACMTEVMKHRTI